MIYALRVEPDGQLTPTWVSENVERLMGYTAQEAFSFEWWASHVHPEDRERVLEYIRTNLGKKDEWTQEYRFRHKDGDYRWLRDQERVFRDASRTPVEIVGSWSDVSERKAAELMLEESETVPSAFRRQSASDVGVRRGHAEVPRGERCGGPEVRLLARRVPDDDHQGDAPARGRTRSLWRSSSGAAELVSVFPTSNRASRDTARRTDP